MSSAPPKKERKRLLLDFIGTQCGRAEDATKFLESAVEALEWAIGHPDQAAERVKDLFLGAIKKGAVAVFGLLAKLLKLDNRPQKVSEVRDAVKNAIQNAIKAVVESIQGAIKSTGAIAELVRQCL